MEDRIPLILCSVKFGLSERRQQLWLEIEKVIDEVAMGYTDNVSDVVSDIRQSLKQLMLGGEK